MSHVVPLLLLSSIFAVAEQPNAASADTHARQSYVLSQEERLTEAEREMREAIQLAPQKALYHSALAGLLTKQGKLSAARTELQKALELNPPPAVRAQLLERLKELELNLGAQLGRAGRDREGMQMAADAAARFSDNARVLQMLGYFQAKLRLYKDAVHSYSRALQLDPSSPDISIGLATSQFSAGLEDDSIRTLEVGITRFPNDAMHYQALGVVLLQLAEAGRETKVRARAVFEKAVELDSALEESNYQLGRMELDANEVDSAENHLLAAERSTPADSRVHFVLARLYRKRGKADEAQREMKVFSAAKSVEDSARPAATERAKQ